MSLSGHALEYQLAAAAPEEAMERLLAAFPNKPLQTRASLLELFERERELFVGSSLRFLREGRTGHGYRFLLTQLLEKGVFVDVLLARAQGDIGEAADMMRAAMRLEPQFDIKLMRWILDSAHKEYVVNLAQNTEALLEILSQASPGNRMLPVVVQFLRNNGGHVRSKAALIMAQRSQRVDLALADADPRVRANAIKALWGLDTPNARRTLRAALEDSHNRVRGNAILGLFRMGDLSVVPELLAMARHGEPNFRATSAWVMGESRDRAFLPRLQELAADSEDGVRKSAGRAMEALAVAAEESAIESSLPVRVLRVSDAGKGRKRITLCVQLEGLGGERSLSARVAENGEPVSDVQTRRVEHNSLALGLVLPEAWPDEIQVAIRRLMAVKRDVDRLAAVCYSERSTRTVAPKLVFSSVPQWPSRRAPNADAMESAAVGIRALLATPTGLAAHSDIVLFASDAAGLNEASVAKVAQEADRQGTFVHVVAGPGTEPEVGGLLRKLCAESGGVYFHALEAANYARLTESLYYGLSQQVEVIYRSAAGEGSWGLELEILSGDSIGRTKVKMEEPPALASSGERVWFAFG